MAAATRDIIIERRARYARRYLMTNSDDSPYDLTGLTPLAQVRETPDSTTKVCDMVVTVNGLATAGDFTISIDSAVTALLKAGIYHWDFFLGALRLLEGKATVVRTTSR